MITSGNKKVDSKKVLFRTRVRYSRRVISHILFIVQLNEIAAGIGEHGQRRHGHTVAAAYSARTSLDFGSGSARVWEYIQSVAGLLNVEP